MLTDKIYGNWIYVSFFLSIWFRFYQHLPWVIVYCRDVTVIEFSKYWRHLFVLEISNWYVTARWAECLYCIYSFQKWVIHPA